MARQQRQFPQGKYILRSQKKSQDGQQYAVYLYYYWRGIIVFDGHIATNLIG